MSAQAIEERPGGIRWRDARAVATRWRNERRPWSPLVPYLWRGFRAGRRARFLPPLVLEDHFDEPLDALRVRLRIEPLPAAMNPHALPPIAPSGLAAPATA